MQANGTFIYTGNTSNVKTSIVSLKFNLHTSIIFLKMNRFRKIIHLVTFVYYSLCCRLVESLTGSKSKNMAVQLLRTLMFFTI